jgi:hypothetical protein
MAAERVVSTLSPHRRADEAPPPRAAKRTAGPTKRRPRGPPKARVQPCGPTARANEAPLPHRHADEAR